MTTLRAPGLRIPLTDGPLYRDTPAASPVPAELTFIPYFAWANRGEGEMCVWVRE
jgi:DUF1680 family protein